ncbi:MAG: HAD-IC family P-type ATPase, partial [Albidovulum sp.]
ALERLAEVDTIVFDKTGTLTLGTPMPLDLSGHDRQSLIVAVGLAGASNHPLSRALVQGLRDMGIAPAAIEDVREVPGYGVEGRWQGSLVRLGRAEWLGANAVEETATYLRIGASAPVAFRFSDSPRTGADAAIAALRAAGKRVLLMSGDTEAPVASLARELGLTEWQSQALPEEKAALVTKLQAEGRKVLMVGDGLNDTAALASAHVSISPASALDAARVASDIVLLGQDLSPLPDALRIAVQARRRIKQNFALSLAYNVVAVPVALIGLATPLIAALAMSTSSVTVSLNALRLK